LALRPPETVVPIAEPILSATDRKENYSKETVNNDNADHT